MPAHLLGRQVTNGAHHRPWISNLLPGIEFRTDTLVALWPQLRQTKVEDLHAAVIGDEEIFGLQIAMGDPSFMRRCETLSNLLSVVTRLAWGSGPSLSCPRSSSPSRSSETMYGEPSCTPISYTARMFGWFNVPAACASCSNRCNRSASCESAAGRTLIATSRFSFSSRAR